MSVALSDMRQTNDLNVRLSVYAELTAGSGAIELAADYERLVRESTIVYEQHREEAKRLGFLREHVLTNPQMARLWWLNNDREKLSELDGKEEDFFEKAMLLLTGRAPGSGENDHIAQIIDEFLRGLSPAHRGQLITQVSRVFMSYERADLAEKLNHAAGTGPRDVLNARDATVDGAGPTA